MPSSLPHCNETWLGQLWALHGVDNTGRLQLMPQMIQGLPVYSLEATFKSHYMCSHRTTWRWSTDGDPPRGRWPLPAGRGHPSSSIKCAFFLGSPSCDILYTHMVSNILWLYSTILSLHYFVHTLTCFKETFHSYYFYEPLFNFFFFFFNIPGASLIEISWISIHFSVAL